jgi:hypothetical protein
LHDLCENIADTIAGLLKGSFDRSHNDESDINDEDEQIWINESVVVPNVFFRFYASDGKKSLEEVQETHLIQSLGGNMDILTVLVGYSEYTITGCNIENFTIGNHDMEEILNGYIGKYIHILIDY